MKITLLIPVKDELIGLKNIMPRIDPNWVDQILFVDGNSTDGSVDFIYSLGYPVIIQERRGIRRAFIEAFPHITGDVIITFRVQIWLN